jgi:hypothetical protein
MAKAMTLVHPNATVQVPVRLVVSKCDLFVDDPGLTAFPYHLKSRVSVNDFREFVSALEDRTVKVTKDNFRGLLHLSEEFRFRALAAHLSQFRASADFEKDTEAQIAIPMTEINHNSTRFADRFKFTSENANFECSIGQAIALSPAVREQLSVDACARTFALNDVRAVDSVRCLLSGGAVSVERSRNGLGRQLYSPFLELALAGTDRFDLDSVDLSVFSVEALDEVLCRASLSIGREEYHPLLSRIEIRFVAAFWITCFIPLLRRGGIPRSFLTFRTSLRISRQNNLLLCGAASATVSARATFTAVATGTRTH